MLVSLMLLKRCTAIYAEIKIRRKTHLFKIKKKAKIRNRFSQESHLTQDTAWESDTNTRNSPLQAGGHKAAMNRQDSKKHK